MSERLDSSSSSPDRRPDKVEATPSVRDATKPPALVGDPELPLLLGDNIAATGDNKPDTREPSEPTLPVEPFGVEGDELVAPPRTAVTLAATLRGETPAVTSAITARGALRRPPNNCSLSA